MFKNIKLGTQIGGGFATLVLIAMALGGVALWSMWRVQTGVVQLSKEDMPQVSVSNGLNTEVMEYMFEMRGYSMSEDEKYWKPAEAQKEHVLKEINGAKTLAASSQRLSGLRSTAEDAAKAFSQYADLSKTTSTAFAERRELLKTLGGTGVKFLDSCRELREFYASQIKAGAAGELLPVQPANKSSMPPTRFPFLRMRSKWPLRHA